MSFVFLADVIGTLPQLILERPAGRLDNKHSYVLVLSAPVQDRIVSDPFVLSETACSVGRRQDLT